MFFQALGTMANHLYPTQPNSQISLKGWIDCNKISEHYHRERFLQWIKNRETLDRNWNSKKKSIGEEPGRNSEQSDGISLDEWVYPLDNSRRNSRDLNRNSQPTKSVSFEGSSPKKSSRTSSLPNVSCPSTSKQHLKSPVKSSIVRYLASVFGHFVSFFIKGGISAMMFIVELILHFFMHVLEILNIPGSSTLGAVVNGLLFLSTMSIWLLYSAVELIFVLPVKLQLPYIVLLIFVYFYTPIFIKDFIQSLLWATVRFFRFFKGFFF